MDYYDIFNGTCPDDLPLGDSPIDAGRVMGLVRAEVKSRARPRRLGRTVRVALAAAAIVAALGVTAWATGIIRIVKVEKPIILGTQDSDEDIPAIDISFDKTEPGPIAPLGVWEVDMPAGYEKSFSFSSADFTNEGWTNGEGSGLTFTYRRAGTGGDVTLTEEEIQEKRDVTVNGQPGTLYVTENGSMLLWTDQEAGVGFMMSADESLDMLALAETVHRTGDTPEMDEYTQAALEDLGDWTITDLPEGYNEYTTQGRPKDQGGGWYAYVRRYWTDPAGHTVKLNYENTLGPSYENYVSYWRQLADTPQEEIDMVRAKGGSVRDFHCTVTDVTVQGRPAGLVVDADGMALRLAWLNGDGSVAFILESDGLSGEELMALAESVELAE